MAGEIKKAKGGKKQRKFGRNKMDCLAYRNENRREKSRVRRIKRHLKRFPMDAAAVAHMERFKNIIQYGNATRGK